MAQETSKATERRLKDNSRDWYQIFHGSGIDIGAGDDLMRWPDADIIPFDKEHGDANRINEYFGFAQFDFVHGSQVMEHLFDSRNFIERCLHIVKPGGWIVMTVPDFDLYERGHWPSRWNPDHKGTWSLWRKGNGLRNVKHAYVPEWIKPFQVAQRFASLIDTNYDYLCPESKDQTWLRQDGVECFIEILLQKP